MPKHFLSMIVVSLLLQAIATAQPSQRDRSVQLHEVDSSIEQRLEQFKKSMEANAIEEAIQILQRVDDQSDGRLRLATLEPLSRSFPVYLFQPVKLQTRELRLGIGVMPPASRQRWDELQRGVWSKHWETFLESPSETIFRRLLENTTTQEQWRRSWTAYGDLCFQKNWNIAARDAYERAILGMRAPLTSESGMPLGTLPWLYVFEAFPLPADGREGYQEVIARYLERSSMGDLRIEERWSEFGRLWHQMVRCSRREGDIRRVRLEESFLIDVLMPNIRDPQLLQEIENSRSAKVLNGLGGWTSRELHTFSRHLDRNAKTSFSAEIAWDRPQWSQPLPRINAEFDRNPAGPVRTAEWNQGALSYHPVVDRSRVYINEMNRIMAYNLDDGKTWPVGGDSRPLYDSGIPDENLTPLNYPNCGVGRGTLILADESLYARMGATPSAWKSRSGLQVGSASFLVGLDLRSEGRMLPGFPIRLIGADWENCEFEGSPIVVGDWLYVAITQRNNVNLRISVASFHRKNGKFGWRSPLIAAALPEGSDDANVIRHELLSYRDGRLFLSTGLGVIAALDIDDGEIVWAVQYPRVNLREETFPRSNRFRFRDLTPPLLASDLVICAPSDCREIFALNWGTGELIWATDPEIASDAIHLLGVVDDRIVASGDRLYWIHQNTGKFDSIYEGESREGEGLRRGLGRGLLTDQRIYWPTHSQMIELHARLDVSPTGTLQPKVIALHDTGVRGSEGINLIANREHLLGATPNRLLLFRKISR